MISHTVPSDWVGKRLDVYLLSLFSEKGITRSMLEKQIKKNVTVNAKPTKKGYFLRVGDLIEIADVVANSLEYDQDEVAAVKGDLNIIEETEDYIVLNKPKGVPVHPGKGHENDTLANYLRYYLESKNEYDKTIKRGGIIHRLDMDVSGILLCAKKRDTQLYFQQQFEEGNVVKLYLATIKSLNKIAPESDLKLKPEMKAFKDNGYKPDPRWERVEGYIARDPSDRKRMRLNVDRGRNGRNALTYYIPLKDHKMLINIKTGRMHQIRATIKALGWVVENDALYGDTTPNGQMQLEQILLKVNTKENKEKIWKLV